MKWKGCGDGRHYRYQYCSNNQAHRLWLYQPGGEQRYEWDRELIFEIRDGDENELYTTVMNGIIKRSRKVTIDIEGIQHSYLNNYVAIPYCHEANDAIRKLKDYVVARQAAKELTYAFNQEAAIQFMGGEPPVPGYAGDPP